MIYYRPIVSFGPTRPDNAQILAGGAGWFTLVECLERGREAVVVPAGDIPGDALARLTAARSDLAGLPMGRPHLMGILNVTPDSFSDGGQFTDLDTTIAHARQMVADGAAILDVGGESTRPGADFVPADEEIARTAPVIQALGKAMSVPVSIDTRKAQVAARAITSGAKIVNDVSALSYDPDMGTACAKAQVPVCLMHAQGDPKTMQDAPTYDDVLLDVYDYLAARIALAEEAGINRANICVDPGIGFGKTLAHNLELLSRISLFHSLGCPVLLGASRKRFIGTLTGVKQAASRMPGSVGVALAAASQGVQIIRVHDIPQTYQALTTWRAATVGKAG
ncbi:dihydropteroate synthase [Aliiroseovarius sp. PTFE2010]|uniref:dihydropteroate synthase n=1 Tax=Aliiroseovarius sp. PTFE2010 TaxID=3417190 RepID=UPI003CFB7888